MNNTTVVVMLHSSRLYFFIELSNDEAASKLVIE